jgi:hypothetical protein
MDAAALAADMRVLTNFIVLHYDDVRYTDLEIEEAMDELDEEEMTPINEGVSELIDDLELLRRRLVLLSRRRDQDPVEKKQDPNEEVQDPVEEEQEQEVV